MQTNIRKQLIKDFYSIENKENYDLLYNFQKNIPKNIEPLEELFPYYWKLFQKQFYNNFKKNGHNKNKNLFKFTLKALISWIPYFFKGITYNKEKIINALENDIEEFELLFKDVIIEQINILKK